MVSSIRVSISRAPRVIAVVAHRVQGRWIRESINRGPRETVGVDDRKAGVNPVARRRSAAAGQSSRTSCKGRGCVKTVGAPIGAVPLRAPTCAVARCAPLESRVTKLFSLRSSLLAHPRREAAVPSRRFRRSFDGGIDAKRRCKQAEGGRSRNAHRHVARQISGVGVMRGKQDRSCCPRIFVGFPRRSRRRPLAGSHVTSGAS